MLFLFAGLALAAEPVSVVILGTGQVAQAPTENAERQWVQGLGDCLQDSQPGRWTVVDRTLKAVAGTPVEPITTGWAVIALSNPAVDWTAAQQTYGLGLTPHSLVVRPIRPIPTPTPGVTIVPPKSAPFRGVVELDLQASLAATPKEQQALIVSASGALSAQGHAWVSALVCERLISLQVTAPAKP